MSSRNTKVQTLSDCQNYRQRREHVQSRLLGFRQLRRLHLWQEHIHPKHWKQPDTLTPLQKTQQRIELTYCIDRKPTATKESRTPSNGTYQQQPKGKKITMQSPKISNPSVEEHTVGEELYLVHLQGSSKNSEEAKEDFDLPYP